MSIRLENKSLEEQRDIVNKEFHKLRNRRLRKIPN